MKYLLLLLALLLTPLVLLRAADAPAQDKPPLKITPGKVVVPTDRMKRIWGELISLDQTTRTGKFRNESNDEVMNFTVMPYAELLHHATLGDLQDFRVGERAIFRLHENDKGEWVWLTYIQDEMNMLNNHKEYFHVDSINAEKGQLTCTWATGDKSFVRTKDVLLETDTETRYWKAGKVATFADIKVGDKLRTKTHGLGKGKNRVAWEIFLDDESLLRFQAEQKAVHARRMQEEGLPAYVDSSDKGEVQLTVFREAGEALGRLKAGQKVRLSPAGVDRKPSDKPVEGKIVSAKNTEVKISIPEATNGVFRPAGLARVWLVND